MTTEENLKKAKEKLAGLIDKGLEKPTLGERFQTGLVSGVIASVAWMAMSAVLTVAGNKYYYKRPWNDGFDLKESLGTLGLGAGFFGVIGGIFGANSIKRNRSMNHIRQAHENVVTLENEAALHASVIQTAGAEHTLLNPHPQQAQTRQL